MQKILCIGNRYIYPDSAALHVYDTLNETNPIESSIEWVEGGIGGLSLITHFENVKRILILDYMGDIQNGSFFSLDDVLEVNTIQGYTHESAFYYLLASLEELLQKVPQITFLSCNPANENFVEKIFTQVQLWSSYESH